MEPVDRAGNPFDPQVLQWFSETPDGLRDDHPAMRPATEDTPLDPGDPLHKLSDNDMRLFEEAMQLQRMCAEPGYQGLPPPMDDDAGDITGNPEDQQLEPRPL